MKVLILISALFAVTNVLASSVLNHPNCNLHLLTNNTITGYDSEFIQLLIDKGYKPSLVKQSEILAELVTGDLALEYNLEVDYDLKTCSEKISLVKITNLEPVRISIISTNELKRKTIFGNNIKCKSSKALLSLTPKCQIQ